jgi:hypothetical protein
MVPDPLRRGAGGRPAGRRWVAAAGGAGVPAGGQPATVSGPGSRPAGEPEAPGRGGVRRGALGAHRGRPLLLPAFWPAAERSNGSLSHGWAGSFCFKTAKCGRGCLLREKAAPARHSNSPAASEAMCAVRELDWIFAVDPIRVSVVPNIICIRSRQSLCCQLADFLGPVH